jgi:hypothetical protein
VAKAFDDTGRLLDERAERRIDGMLTELLWMAATLRHGREHIRSGTDEVMVSSRCEDCHAPLNHHASVIDEEGGGENTRISTCPACGAGTARPDLPA